MHKLGECGTAAGLRRSSAIGIIKRKKLSNERHLCYIVSYSWRYCREVCVGTAAIDIIQSQPALEKVVDALSGTPTVFFDTEFLREKTYFPQLCLMQLRIGQKTYLVDPLAGLDLERFWQALLATKLVMHSGRQDLEVLLIGAGELPTNVFDTQIAAGLVGMPPQIGYAKLVESVCSVSLDKAHTRTNWSRRPLPQGVLQYAADDVNYLPAIVEHLESALNTLSRADWMRQDCEDLISPELYENDAATAWQRVKGFGHLPAIAQPSVMSLCEWREKIAQSYDRPRQWIVRDDALINIALAAPDSAAAVADIDGVPPKFAERHSQAVIDVLQAPLPIAPAFSARPDEAERKRVKRMAAVVRRIASELGIEAEILAPQRELRIAARGSEDIRAFRGWREPLIGKLIRAELDD